MEIFFLGKSTSWVQLYLIIQSAQLYRNINSSVDLCRDILVENFVEYLLTYQDFE